MTFFLPNTSPNLHHRYKYHMLPSKNNDVNVAYDASPTERNEGLDQPTENVGMSWKRQTVLDLTPSRRRDT
jgi:hypothetical protein